MNRLKTHLFLFFGLWLAILVAAGMMLSRTVRMLKDDANWVSHTHEVLEAAQTTLATLVEAESGERGYLVTNDPVYLDPYRVALGRLRGDTGRLESLIQDNPRQVARVNQLKGLIAARLRELAETVALNGSDPAAARRNVVTNLALRTMDGIRDRFDALGAEERLLLAERERADGRSYRIATLAGILYGLLGLAGVGGLLVQVLRHARDREKFEVGLEAQRALLDVTLRSIGDALITTDASGAVIFMNPVAEALTGWRTAEASGHPLAKVFQIINEQTGEPAVNPMGRVLGEGVVLALANHTSLVSRDGQAIPIEDSAAPIKDASGTVIGLVLVFHDVTAKRKAEDELAGSERRYRNLTNLSPNAIWINRNERIELANPEGHRLLGARLPGELEGKSIYELWHPDSHQKVRARLRAAAEGQVVQLSEETIVRLDGTVRQVEVSSAPFEDAFGPAVQCVVRDITERVAALDELRHSEERYRTLFSAMIEGFCIIEVLFDPDGHPVDHRFLETNPAFEALTGLANAVGKRIRELAPDNESYWIELYGRVASTGEPARFVNEAKAFSRWFDVSAYRVGGAGSHRVAILFNDISARIQAEAERRRMEERISQAQRLESLGVLVAGVAHNFNNILAVIMGTASVQETQVADAGELEAMRMIVTACRRGRGLVQSLTHFARPSLAQQLATDLNQLAAEVASLIGSTAPKNISIAAEFAGEALWINGDPGNLSTALMNLCLNGLDAMPQGGTLTLRTRSLSQGWVEVVVDDSGEGMAPEVLARATEPFFTTKPVGKGTGLGLSMVHGVAQAHGGTLELSSTPGQGTQVRIRLPRLKAPAEPAPDPGPRPAGKPFSVLLVDDEVDVRTLLTRMLRNAGIAQVTAVRGGREALDALDSGVIPDLVILDQNMPGLDGVQTLALMRQSHPALPVLIASGQPGIQDWEAFKKEHVAVISKPFTLEEIELKLAEMGVARPREGR